MVNNTGNQATGALTVTLSGTNATSFALSKTSISSIAASGNDSFTVEPNIGLAVGTYTATVTVSGGANITARSFNVSFTVNPVPTYSISASQIDSFDFLTTPYTQPSAQTVTITNTGTGSVTLTQPTADNYVIGTLNRTTLSTSGTSRTAKFTVRPKADLPLGNYNEIITIYGSEGTFAEVEVSFEVLAPTYTISASQITSFDSLTMPYTQPKAQTVTITNTGTGKVTLMQPTSDNYVIGTLNRTTLAVSGTSRTATFTVRPKADLPFGNYDEMITVLGSDGTFAEVEVSFTVLAPTYTISASQITSFGSLTTSYTQPIAQTITITNTGTGSVTLMQPTSDNYAIGTLSRTTLATSGTTRTATFTVRPKTGLPLGNYDEIITVFGNDGAFAEVEISFSIIPPTHTISASQVTSFGSLGTPYTQPATRTAMITNTGTGQVTLTQPTSNNYIIGTLNRTTLATSGATSTATFTIRPKADLPIGNYDETITVFGNDGAFTEVRVSFTVLGETPMILSITPDIETKNLKVNIHYPLQNSAILVVAVYDGDRKLLGFNTETVTKSDEITITGLTIPITNGTKIKAMMWDGVNTMLPLYEAKTTTRIGGAWN